MVYRKYVGVAGIIFVVGLVPALYAQTNSLGLRPELPTAKGESCVEPVDVMRRDHMKFLFHQRDQTVHRGIRTKQHSLTGCLDCHAQQDEQGNYIRIDAPGQFCQVCHAYTSTRIDCFECHAAKPAVDASLLGSLTQ